MKQSRVEEALEALNAGEPWDKLVKKHGKSSLYKALSKYFESSEKKYQKMLEDKRKLDTDIKASKKEAEALKENLATQRNENKVLESTNEKLRGKRNELKSELKRVKTESTEIKSGITSLINRGLSKEFLEKISKMDATSEEDLLTRVQTSKDYSDTIQNLSDSKKQLAQLEKLYSETNKKIGQVQEEHRSELNKLAEAKQENQYWSSAIELVISFLKLGFSREILESLLNAVARLSIRGQPKASVKRFLRRLEKVVEEDELDIRIEGKEARLQTLKKEISRATGILKALSDDVTRPIRETQEKSIVTINNVTNNLLQTIRAVEQQVSEALMGLEASGEESIKAYSTRLQKTLLDLTGLANLGFREYHRTVADWGEIKEDVGRYETYITMAKALMVIEESPQHTNKLPLSFIVSLMEGIHRLILAKYPIVETKPPSTIATDEWYLSTFTTLKLSTLSGWLLYHLRTLAQESNI